MLQSIYSLIDEADVVVHFNGTKFYIPTLNKEFVLMGWPPPSPILEVDLYLAVKKRFKFHSNKLSYIAGQLGLGDKVEHKGMDLWRDCMAGDKKAWELMKRYNKQDVALLHGLYEIIKPWLPRHPNFNVYDDVEKPRCPICGSTHIQKRGKIHTRSQAYQRYYCNDCNGWSRERTSLLTKEKRKSVLVGAV